VVAALIGIVEIICIGGLILLGIGVLAEVLERRERRHNAELQQRLQAFHSAQRIRQTAAAKQAAFELSMLAYQTAQAMLREVIEADSKAAKPLAKKRS
jgi:arginine/lysine/ornithine decarboxylase